MVLIFNHKNWWKILIGELKDVGTIRLSNMKFFIANSKYDNSFGGCLVQLKSRATEEEDQDSFLYSNVFTSINNKLNRSKSNFKLFLYR